MLKKMHHTNYAQRFINSIENLKKKQFLIVSNSFYKKISNHKQQHFSAINRRLFFFAVVAAVTVAVLKLRLTYMPHNKILSIS